MKMLVESNPANISCFPRRLQEVFAIRLPKTSSRCLQDVFARRLTIMSSRHLERQKNVTLKTSSPRQMFAGKFSGVNQWNEGGR